MSVEKLNSVEKLDFYVQTKDIRLKNRNLTILDDYLKIDATIIMLRTTTSKILPQNHRVIL